MEVVEYQPDGAVIRLAGTEVLALTNICNNTASGPYERPEREMAASLRDALSVVLETLRPEYGSRS